MKMEEKRKTIKLGIALIPILFLMAALSLCIVVLKQPPHIPLIGAVAVAAVIAVAYEFPWNDVQKGMLHGIFLAMDALLILMVVGTMIGTWILGGIVPCMIYYGLKILTPGIFLAATVLICSVVALGTGSSWSTVGTIGIALIGVGEGLGVPLPMVAGAIISGAYFGDKMSPLSDTTNLAPAIAGTNLFAHIRHMVYTTLPAYLITVTLFILIGLRFTGSDLNTADIEIILGTLRSNFTLSPFLLIPPGIVILMVVKRMPPLPALLGGTIMGGICAGLAQSATLADMLQSAFAGFVSTTGTPQVDGLLTRGGLLGMMETVALIICALAFGGIMEKTGMLDAIARAILKRIKRTGSLVTATILSCLGMNLIVANQLLSIILPGRMVRHAFDARNLHPKNLSRCLEDAGTLSSPLIPWNSCGAFMHVTLGVNPLVYLPFAFFNLLTPIISMVYGYTGFSMVPKEESESLQ